MERKLREVKGSLMVTIPKQVCNLYDFKGYDKTSLNIFELSPAFALKMTLKYKSLTTRLLVSWLPIFNDSGL